ncbi:MAG: UDP-N-acetylglucosamine-N-acetylmuramyl- (pentapeptide) pyrophosphoryl-undecaprenol N- acetylglucosamine transferase [Candidatus Uhrbacteria bacterium GW2011_GWD2_41_121]|uniref:UDP-N-acetylglucosamine--N-acetylmuramyl-(pentapeptide) pyrophosphoryl-undecaprenol N-acetylglucosamine transferase n=1 Tax=Candidatus Uhrbacteria bacterium GW2011_GWC1_41_20 TaxID=1618983 RepID=A0A0G0VED1_9BACT|nr:MAG: UDP-N-acetylglucosamine-N-acetylmuramyl- (pentapeptide) pyrophosphoryl-undecaprenol N- acetylglucosamine transferase [Candidatus Uhrbacteria bacterium GW2011_GWE1_39_46]KKR63922.1 MAG: UDP-N-acetylglucosamine-N-acetylmuramyl- (pentapeptide) pyrophosphoryl-undecaprenol N- acetylglucosamine transferase [Candidatus Uhrbacteria bacterium GW2011_GWC2_40_450]KKR90166.1 MAG: UDP-N-acetylglucosamine-N-acetylmuramyl- (pentapeptide) pyrophosphoryl-undecaprenol N- acetylglucosamine transferase [Cand
MINDEQNIKRILMTGGGTLGPVTPLLAIVEEWQSQEEVEVFWIGTRKGPELALVASMNIPFSPIVAPKFDRACWWKWWMIPIVLLIGCIESFIKLREIRPDIVFTAGGYVSVPVVIMAWALRIPVWVHQLDIVPGLANKIMAPFAHQITVTWPESLESFSQKKTTVVGGVMRHALLHGDRDQIFERYELSKDRPTLLVMGGGTGAQAINETMEAIGSDLLEDMQIIHLTGKGKMTTELENMGEGYLALEFLGLGMRDAFAMADLVVARAGMGTIIELSALRKPSIFIPLHNTDQLANARMIEDRAAGEVLWDMNPQILQQTISRLMFEEDQCKRLSYRISALFSAFGAKDIVRMAGGMGLGEEE